MTISVMCDSYLSITRTNLDITFARTLLDTQIIQRAPASFSGNGDLNTQKQIRRPISIMCCSETSAKKSTLKTLQVCPEYFTRVLLIANIVFLIFPNVQNASSERHNAVCELRVLA